MKKIIWAVVALVVIGLGVSGYNFFNTLNTERVTRETSVSAAYQESQLELDTYVKQIKESVGIANVKSDKLDQILRDAVSGRYGDSKADAAGNKNGQGGSFFSAVVEAYPDLKGQLDVYDKIVDKVFTGREAFKTKQTELRRQVADYERWINTGLVQSIMIKKVIGAPTDLLEARIGKNVKTGRAALEQMKLLVTSGRTNDNFESGQEDPIDFEKK